jgi:hypothetical protein
MLYEYGSPLLVRRKIFKFSGKNLKKKEICGTDNTAGEDLYPTPHLQSRELPARPKVEPIKWGENTHKSKSLS